MVRVERLGQMKATFYNTMLRKIFMLYGFMIILGLGSLSPSISDNNPGNNLGYNPNSPVNNLGYTPGWIFVDPLFYFTPVSMQKACVELHTGDFKDAQKAFSQEMTTNPHDLASYVGLIQSEPSIWGSLMQTLENQHRLQPKNADIMFKLGVLYFYSGLKQFNVSSMIQAKPDIAKGQELLTNAWAIDKSTIVGYMYMFAFVIIPTQIPNGTNPNNRDVINELLVSLIGNKAFEKYQLAKSKGWSYPPPDISHIPAKNLLPLKGIVGYLNSLVSSTVGYGKIINNHAVFKMLPLTVAQKREHQYDSEWIIGINDALRRDKITSHLKAVEKEVEAPSKAK